MARSDFLTWLPLDEMAQILGLNPLKFNQLYSDTLFPNNVCGDVFFQHDWDHSDRVGRDTIAMTVQQAELEIAREVGYNLMPDWTLDERVPYPRPAVPESYNIYGVNPRYQMKSVETKLGHVICGGIRTKTIIQAGCAVGRSDADGDGYSELCTVTLATSVTNTNEIHVYYPGRGGDDGWEIRPIKISLAGGIATITFNSWLIVLGTELERFAPETLDAHDAANYETTVDVYRVYNDPSQQATLAWENQPVGLNCCGTCTACQLNAQEACFHVRENELGIVVPAPATWNTSTSSFDSAEYSVCREPDWVRLWYYSGYIDQKLPRPYAELSNSWKYPIAFYAASKFDRGVCGCSNVREFIDKWRRDAAFSSQDEGGFTLTAEQASNRLGTTMGAMFAYRYIQRPGIRINK